MRGSDASADPSALGPEDFCGLGKRQAQPTRAVARRIPITQVDEDVSLPAPVGEEGGLHDLRIEAAHRPGCKTKRTRREDDGLRTMAAPQALTCVS